MNPRLISIAGPLKNSCLEFQEGTFSIGRDSDNDLIINDLSVSRHHCVIDGEQGVFKLKDLGSHNGTFVNDIPINERILEHRDQLRIGNSLFFFLRYETEKEPIRMGDLEDSTFDTRTALQLHIEDVLYSMARDLSMLTRISQAISSIRNLQDLQWKLLALILEALPAQRATIMLFETATEEPSSCLSRERTKDAINRMVASRTVVRKVMTEHVALLVDVASDEALREVKSLNATDISAILCVPLVFAEECLGVIYLEASDPTIRFNEDHLRLLFAIANHVAVAIENARHVEWLISENKRLQCGGHEYKMIGESLRMRQLFRVIGQVAPTDSTVLIRGESGTGKELAARAIHDNSPRASKPFIAVNCATLTETLLESELFGHEKGAFTGAVTQKMGKLEAGNGGTLFLDEVAEMPLIVQAKLLRVLQEREFVRVGGIRQIKVDIRLIAATNRNLESAIAAHTFRDDLYYRLNVISITMPSLKERVGDIPLLVQYFAAKYSERCNQRQLRGISREANLFLLNYDWPGNVRELENVIERAVVLGQTPIIQPEDLPEVILEKPIAKGITIPSYHQALNAAKREIILEALERVNGNYLQAANALGIHVNNLHRMIRNLELKPLLKK
jgi:transcriptional regulator with GAF, ATPase, and Fis domain